MRKQAAAQAVRWSARVLALVVSLGAVSYSPNAAMAQTKAKDASTAAAGNDPNDKRINAIPISQLVTATCRQAWHLGGNNEDAFFDIVERLTALSAHNRGVTLPDDKDAGSRAGQWIREQALKDPDQLLYAVVDHAVVYNAKGGTTAGTAKQ